MSAVTTTSTNTPPQHVSSVTNRYAHAGEGWTRGKRLFIDRETIAAFDKPWSGSPDWTYDSAPVPLIILKATALFEAAPSLEWKKAAQIGVPRTGTWDALVWFLSDSRLVDPKNYGNDLDIAKRSWGGWVGGKFTDNHRVLKKFESTRLLIVDVDGNANVERLAFLFTKYRVIIHTTFKSTDENPRARLVLMLKTPCTDAREYKRAHDTLRRWLNGQGFVTDDGASDCARLNYIPTHRPGYAPKFHTHEGELIDLGALAGPLVEPKPEPEPAARRQPQEGQRGDGRGALKYAVNKIERTANGARHTALYSMARWLGEIPELHDADGEIQTDLVQAARPENEKETAEFKAAVRDGLKKGRAR